MKKNKLKFLTFLSLAFLFTFIFSACSMSKNEPEIINNENEPVKIEVEPEMMSVEEKELLGIDISSNVQILGRDEEGNISAYKNIDSEEDVVKYQDELEALLVEPNDSEAANGSELDENTIVEEIIDTDLIIE